MNNGKNNLADETIKIGVIGLGRMGLMHAALFNSFEESKLVAVADPSKFPASQLKQVNPLIKVYRDGDELLEKEELDGVLIASPVSSHIPLSILCTEKGIPFLLEKPLSLNCEEAVPLLNKIKEKNNINIIGYCYRFMDSFGEGRKILNAGCLGNIQRVSATIYRSQLFKR